MATTAAAEVVMVTAAGCRWRLVPDGDGGGSGDPHLPVVDAVFPAGGGVFGVQCALLRHVQAVVIDVGEGGVGAE